MASQISGYVKSDPTLGNLPTQDVTVAWFLVANPSVRGVTSTNADGFYEINILVSALMIRLSQTTCNIALLFAENGTCGQPDSQH